MATWRLDVDISFQMDSSDMEEWPEFVENRPGPQGDLLEDRIFLDIFIGRGWIDKGIRWDLMTNRSTSLTWTINGSSVKGGTDGIMQPPSTFISSGVLLADVDVGRVIQVPAPASPLLARGHYLIASRTNNNIVTIDGIFPTSASAVTFQINEPAEFLATLLST